MEGNIKEIRMAIPTVNDAGVVDTRKFEGAQIGCEVLATLEEIKEALSHIFGKQDIFYTLRAMKEGRNCFVKLDDGGYPYTHSGGTPFRHCNYYSSENDAREDMNIILQHWADDFPDITLEKWTIGFKDCEDQFMVTRDILYPNSNS